MLLLRGKHLVCSPKNWSAQDKPKTKVLFIGKDPDHGYGSHMYMHTRRMLGKCVELTPEVEMIVYKGRHKDTKTLEGAKTIVIYTSPAAEVFLEGPHRGQVAERRQVASQAINCRPSHLPSLE